MNRAPRSSSRRPLCVRAGARIPLISLGTLKMDHALGTRVKTQLPRGVGASGRGAAGGDLTREEKRAEGTGPWPPSPPSSLSSPCAPHRKKPARAHACCVPAPGGRAAEPRQGLQGRRTPRTQSRIMQWPAPLELEPRALPQPAPPLLLRRGPALLVLPASSWHHPWAGIPNQGKLLPGPVPSCKAASGRRKV